MANPAVDLFRKERLEAIEDGASSFVFSANGVTYRRVSSKKRGIIKFKRSSRGSKRKKGSRKRRRGSRRGSRR